MTSAATVNPYDGTAAMVVPQNVQKLPLYHWRPGSRVLSVGSRDGASFTDELPADEQRTYRRALSPQLIARAAERAGVDTWCASWTASLRYPEGLACLRASGLATGVVSTPAHGDPELAQQLLTGGVAAWLLLLPDDQPPGPLAQLLMQATEHTEVVLGLTGAVPAPELQALPWNAIAAVHLQPRRPALAAGTVLQQWEQAARGWLPDTLPMYDSRHQVTVCGHCHEELIWRHAGRIRLVGFDTGDSSCPHCGAPLPITW